MKRTRSLIALLVMLSMFLGPVAPTQAAPSSLDYLADGFGNRYNPDAPFNWISASVNSGLTGDDAASGPLDIGFPFPFYGRTETQLFISTNGLISFGGPYPSSHSESLSTASANHLIAVYWMDLLVGVSGNTGGVYYSRGGTAPDRHLVIEWRNVKYSAAATTVSFEVILYENGNLSFQYGPNVPDSETAFQKYMGAKSITGRYQFEYNLYGIPVAQKNILFTYAVAAAEHVEVDPIDNWIFAGVDADTDIPLTVYNIGNTGPDTYQVFLPVDPPGPYTVLWDAPGNPPLTDTDADGDVDTGPVPQGGSVKVIFRLQLPAGTPLGDHDPFVISVSSADGLGGGDRATVNVYLSVPATFMAAFGDSQDGSMRILSADRAGSAETKPGPAGTGGYHPAMTEIPNGNYFYAWQNTLTEKGQVINTLQYTIVSRDASFFLPAARLMNPSYGTFVIKDVTPSVAAAPDGTLGMVWRRETFNKATGKYNYNVYLATFNSAGDQLTTPTNISNNTSWGAYQAPMDGPSSSPAIAASTNNRFVIAWQERSGQDSIAYAVRNTAGALVRGPIPLPAYNSEGSRDPVLNSLDNGRVIITFGCGLYGPCYSVVNDLGKVIKAPGKFGVHTTEYGRHADAVQLPNGDIAVAWAAAYPGFSGSVQYAILDASYARIHGPTGLYRYSAFHLDIEDRISVTTDEDSHVIISVPLSGEEHRSMAYALANPDDTYITRPRPYRVTTSPNRPNQNGQGIARVRADIPAPGPFNKTAPLSGSTGLTQNPVISWEYEPYAAYYQYCFDTIDDGICNTSWSAPIIKNSAQLRNLKHKTTYYWQVRGVSAGGEIYANGSENASWSFTTYAELVSGWYGSVTVTSDRALVSVARPHVSAEVASYTGQGAGSGTAYIPMLFKGAFGGSYDAAFYVQNADAVNTAHLTIKFYDSDGILSCTLSPELAPLASKGWWVPGEACLPAGWVGGAVITSDVNIVTVARPHVGAEVMTYNGFSGGSLTAYVPMLFKDAFGGSYDAAFYVQNVGAADANLTITFYDSAGVQSCELTDTLAPFASKGWWLPGLPNNCLPSGWVGSAAVTSDQPVVAIARPHVGTQVTAYSGLPGGGKSMYVPMLFKDAFGGSYDAAFYVQNVDGADADITIKFYDSAGNLSCELSDSIAPLASSGWWVPGLADDCLPAGWVGGAVVTSAQDIVAVGRPHVGAQVTTYPGIPSGSLDVFLPMLFKDAFGGSYDSAFYLQNTDASGPATVTLKFFDADGVLACQRTDTIPGLATLGYWVPNMICEAEP